MISDDRLSRSGDVIGKTILDRTGGKLGAIREVYLDRDTGQAKFAILETGGLFGSGGKFHPVPWRLLRFDADSDAYAAPFRKDDIKGAPAYDREQLASDSYGWGEQVERFFTSP
jgi:sporulation protein YlmC with PRC-barrel domain